MKLAIISNMAHWRAEDGTIVGHGATARELDALSSLFDEVRHVACLHDGPPPASALPYRAANLTLVPLPPAGGESVGAKLDILWHTPRYLAVIRREMAAADAIHIRCPANIPLYAVAMLPTLRAPARRWIKYAGDWQPQRAEPRSYALQRRWLAATWHRAQVTVNGRWPDQPAHVHTFHNPCLTDAELAVGAAIAHDKSLASPMRLVFAGNLIPNKHADVAIEAVAELARRGIAATLDIAGEGAELAALKELARARQIAERITFHGAVPRVALDRLYARAHAVVLPSATEGWPKVLAEGMCAGAIPVATAVGSIPQELAVIGTGTAVAPPPTATAFADALAAWARDPAAWASARDRAVAGARTFSYSTYLSRVRALLDL